MDEVAKKALLMPRPSLGLLFTQLSLCLPEQWNILISGMVVGAMARLEDEVR